ncbi:hypothetical protein AMS68_006766 [Peltaster fructicola]|uniref:Importin N-terminal domain-containing protein n=1 Tax=Peltaster fructicola TaxID=286661 RepID=A0A6H0Y318_9PEZI|nr:hypothetical protein AMS68_006766 [Peltaster fructicola]
MAWTPEPGPLSQLAQVLRDSLSGHDVRAQKNAEQMVEQAKRSPDFINYLTYLTTQSTAATGLTGQGHNAARSAAAIMLKNQVKYNYSAIPVDNLNYIKSTIMSGLRDDMSLMRSYTGNVITELVKQGGIMSWPQVLPEITTIAADGTPNAQDGAMSALYKICEDNRKALDKEYQKQRPLSFLLPKLLEFTSHTSANIRSKALSTINIFLTDPIAQTAQENIERILSRLVSLSTDSDEEVRRFVCRAFATLADETPNLLLPHVQGIIQYTLTQQRQRQNLDLALDASEFFFEASSKTELRDSLGPYLAEIVPVLLDCMVYSEDDQLRLEGDDDDADEEDDAKDIKPQFATSKRSGQETAPPVVNGQPSNGYAYEDDLSDGEILDDDEEFGDPEDEWNLRKCSAAALDSLALHFGGPVFKQTLPWLMENLQHRDWPNREAAVLAIGAIGPGTIDEVKPHLPQLIPYIITQLNDEQPVVRQISCWALSRFAAWAASLDEAGKQQFFEPMMDGILRHMLDNNKKVQESAASAFATVEEAANKHLEPYCQVIVQQFVQCFERYKDRNMFILYDCVQTLAEHNSPALAKPELVQLLMPALIARWQKVQDASREMFPLLECLSFVATALGPAFSPFAGPFFDRCIRIISQNLEVSLTEPVDTPDKDFLVTSLDLLSAIIQSLPESESVILVSQSKVNMFQLLAYCMKDENNDVRQSAYALLGDCAIYIFDQLRPVFGDLMTLVIEQLDLSEALADPETGFRVINNACWSCGEIAMRAGKDIMQPYTERLLQKLAMILFNSSVPRSLTENAAIALGRLGLSSHQQLAIHLASFAPPFLGSMKEINWTDEKCHALKGFSQVVLDNPQALEKCLLDFLNQMAAVPSVQLEAMQEEGPYREFEMVLQTYKTMIGDFDAFINNLGPEQQQTLRALYSF